MKFVQVLMKILSDSLNIGIDRYKKQKICLSANMSHRTSIRALAKNALMLKNSLTYHSNISFFPLIDKKKHFTVELEHKNELFHEKF